MTYPRPFYIQHPPAGAGSSPLAANAPLGAGRWDTLIDNNTIHLAGQNADRVLATQVGSLPAVGVWQGSPNPQLQPPHAPPFFAIFGPPSPADINWNRRWSQGVCSVNLGKHAIFPAATGGWPTVVLRARMRVRRAADYMYMYLLAVPADGSPGAAAPGVMPIGGIGVAPFTLLPMFVTGDTSFHRRTTYLQLGPQHVTMLAPSLVPLYPVAPPSVLAPTGSREGDGRVPVAYTTLYVGAFCTSNDQGFPGDIAGFSVYLRAPGYVPSA